MSARYHHNYSEIDELNRILTVERELVLKTQENYRALKEKYLELAKENDQLKKEHQTVLEGAENREKLLSLEARSDELIRNMRQANEEREVRYEKFKVDTIEELQNVYRKELQDQNHQIEKLREDRVDLVRENDQLLEEISGLTADLEEFKRREKAKEMEIRSNFDKKLKEIMLNTEKRVSPRLEHFEKTIEGLHAEIQKREEVILEKSKMISMLNSQRNSEAEEFRKVESSLKLRITELENTFHDVNSQRQTDSTENELNATINALKMKNDDLLRERLELELKIRQEQRESSKKLCDVEEKFAVQISEFEKLCDQKEAQIEELRNELEMNEKLQESLDKCERSRQIEEEQRGRLEIEVKSLYEKLQKSGEERQSFESNLKMERDRLEVSLITLKKQLESTPEASKNVEKLNKELRNSERQRLSEKEKNQRIISELKSSLKRLEKNYRGTFEKLQGSFPDFL